MKKNLIYSLLAIMLITALHACHPTKVETENFHFTQTYQLTEDSAKGLLSIDIHADLPAKYKSDEALQEMRSDIITRIFGKKYTTCSNAELLPRFAEDMYADYKAETLPYIANLPADEIGLSFNNEYELEITSVPVSTSPADDERIFSCIADQYTYTGGAHGVRNITCASYDMTNGKRLTEKDLFNNGYEKPLTESIIRHIDLAARNANEPGRTLDDYWKDEIAPNGNFTVHSAGLRYIFNPYEIAPYYIGITIIDLPFEDLKGLLKENSPISHLIKK